MTKNSVTFFKLLKNRIPFCINRKKLPRKLWALVQRTGVSEEWVIISFIAQFSVLEGNGAERIAVKKNFICSPIRLDRKKKKVEHLIVKIGSLSRWLISWNCKPGRNNEIDYFRICRTKMETGCSWRSYRWG